MTETDATGRRSRTKAVSTGKRISLQDRDRLWLAKLAEHGPLPSSFLLHYSKHSHLSDKRAQERLTDLFHEDNTPHGGPYLIRPPQQFRTLDSRYNQLVYDLAPAGWKALEATKTTTRSGPWAHSCMTACITASIELATLECEDVLFISQSAILARSGAELRCPVSVTDPATKRAVTKDLIPDALFGLEYQTDSGSRFRFFMVEADRSTEPATSQNFNRKSFERNLLQYEAYVGGGLYRDHLGLTAPLLVLNVLTDPKRQELLARLVDRVGTPASHAFMLFQTWEAFGDIFKPPEPNGELLNGRWERAIGTPFQINKAQ